MAEVLVGDTRLEVIFDADAISKRVHELAKEIAAAGLDDMLVVSILKGSVIFMADLLRAMHEAGLAPEVEFLSLSSYGAGTQSAGSIAILRDVESDVTGRSVLLVDDILESGRTLAFAKDLLAARGAGELRTCVLLEKPGKLAAELEVDFAGFRCPDRFVVGYGMDMAHSFRQLPFVGVVIGD